MQINSPTPRRLTISLTPLIDVVFILLIFFMLASQFSDWQRLDLQLTSPAEVSDQEQAVQLITLGQQGLQLEKQPVSDEALVNRLQQYKQDKPNTLILIDIDKSASTQQLIDLLSLLKTNQLKPFSLLQDSTHAN